MKKLWSVRNGRAQALIGPCTYSELVLQLAAWGYLREGSGCRFGERFEFTCDVSPVVFRRV